MEVLLDVLADAPRTVVAGNRLAGEGEDLVELLLETDLCSSKSDARRQIRQGAVAINNRRLTADDEERRLSTGDLLHGRLVLLSRGKHKRHVLDVS